MGTAIVEIASQHCDRSRIAMVSRPASATAHPPNRNPGTCEVSQGRRPDTRAKYEESP